MAKKLFVSINYIFFITGIIFSQEVKWEGPSLDLSHGKLKISDNNRFLIFEDGTPFFYLGDTGWELFHRLTKKEAEQYLENRREKGFTVIQAVILAELDGLNTPNMEGDKPLKDNDPTKPNEAYFKHVDWVINKAKEKGLIIGLLPTWGDKVDKKWGVGSVIFNKENAYEYGKYLGERYKSFQNIIWVNGGDRLGGGDNTPIWNALAEGIKSIDKNHLMTFHPNGGHSSSMWFHNEEWLDFNMMQSGHNQRSYAIYERLLVEDYNKHPVKPCFDGEPRYEDHPVGWKPEILGWFDDADMRQALYWNLFSGAFGHTYGCHPIWQMKTPEHNPIGQVRNNWYDVLDLPGAWDLIHARKLIESRPFLDRRPFQKFVLNKNMTDNDYIVATRGEHYAFVYIPTGWATKLDLTLLDWKDSNTWWYNPRTGETKDIGIINNSGIKQFNTPTGGRGNDWILVFDDSTQNFNKP